MIKYTLNIRNKEITVTEHGVGDIGIKIPLEECALFIDEGLLAGLYRADYLIQVLRKHNDLPSKFSITDKLSKYKARK